MSNQVRQTANILIRDDDDISPVAAITPIRSTARNMSLPPKTHTTVASVTRMTFNGVTINKHGGGNVTVAKKPSERLLDNHFESCWGLRGFLASHQELSLVRDCGCDEISF
jgi:hypothetical protein